MQSIGNLAQHFILRRHNMQLQTELATLSEEVASGQTTDPGRRLSGDYGSLADLQRTMQQIRSFDVVAKETGVLFDAARTVVGKLDGHAAHLRDNLARVSNSTTDVVLSTISTDARQAFADSVDALGLQVAGKSVFGGTAVDQPVLQSADEMLQAIKADLVGIATPAAFLDRIDQWFGAPDGGFETGGYLGSTETASPVQVGRSTSVEFSLKADDGAFRTLLRDLAATALASDPDLGLSHAMQTGVLQGTASQSPGTLENLIGVQTGLGIVQGRLETAIAANAAALGTTEMALADLISVDPYETAVRFENVQTRIESLYLTTSRLSSLSLANYLR